MAWIKCPRCLLNYVNDEKEQYCKVCLVDMGKLAPVPEVDLEEDYKLCPECGENYLEEGEEYCYFCRIERIKRDEKDELGETEVVEEEILAEAVHEPPEASLETMAELEDEESDKEDEEE